MRVGSVATALVVLLAAAYRLRDDPPPPQTSETTASAGPAGASSDAGPAVVETLAQESPAEPLPPPAFEAPAEAPKSDATALQEFAKGLASIDPLLADKNVIVRTSDQPAPGFGLIEAEQRFRAEVADTEWSKPMESSILDRVSQIRGLSVTTLGTECRATMCRVKLVYPSSTGALSWSHELNDVALQLGFSHTVEAATMGEDGVPMSLVYLQRQDR